MSIHEEDFPDNELVDIFLKQLVETRKKTVFFILTAK